MLIPVGILIGLVAGRPVLLCALRVPFRVDGVAAVQAHIVRGADGDLLATRAVGAVGFFVVGGVAHAPMIPCR